MSDSTRARPAGVIIAVLAMAGLTVALMQTLMIPLIPYFPRLLNVSLDDASWLITVALLTGAVATPSISRLADMLGKRRMMMVALGAVLVGSVLGALGASLPLLIAARALQGCGFALTPVAISIMRDKLPRERLAAAVALMSGTIGIGGALGLPLSGAIFGHFGFHVVFWISAAMACLMLVAVRTVVPESPVRTGGRFDLLGALLLSAALIALLLGITKGGQWGWTSHKTVGTFIVTGLFFSTWIPWQLRVGQPLVDLRTTVHRPVLMTNISSFLVSFAYYANMLTTTQFLQYPHATGYGFGLSAMQAGIALLPVALIMVLLAPASAAITRGFGGTVTLFVGAAILAVAYLVRIFLVHSEWQVILGATFVAAGLALVFAAIPVLIMRSVPITETAAANGFNSVVRSIGTSTSSAAVAAILTTTTVMIGGTALPSLLAFQHVFVLASMAAIAGGAFALAIPGRHAVVRDTTAGSLDEVRGPGRGHELVARGFVLDGLGVPVEHAIVCVSLLDGEPIDWSRANETGEFDVAVPETGRYLVVSRAPGWAPDAQITILGDPVNLPTIRLSDRLTLSGVVVEHGSPMLGAVVSVTGADGAHWDHGRADSDGRFTFQLPPAGHYVLTGVNPIDAFTRSIDITVGHDPLHVALELTQR
ncbi:MAG: MFS transporter [Dehalococcoidales bacterium]|nr:MFS transporter [Dehalococcoidales bacterium]